MNKVKDKKPKTLEKEFNKYIDMNDPSELSVDLNPIFVEQLENDTLTAEWVVQYAPWKQQDDETDFEHLAFRYFTKLGIDQWDVAIARNNFIESTTQDSLTLDQWKNMHDAHDWITRRVSFMKYLEWVTRKTDELDQLKNIGNFRSNQASLLSEASKASVELVRKLAKRIETLDADEIRVQDIPSFISSVASFLNLASDAEARVLSVSALLDAFADELDSSLLTEHLFYLREE